MPPVFFFSFFPIPANCIDLGIIFLGGRQEHNNVLHGHRITVMKICKTVESKSIQLLHIVFPFISNFHCGFFLFYFFLFPLFCQVNAVKFNEYSSVIVSAGYDQSLRAWDCRSHSTEPIQVYSLLLKISSWRPLLVFVGLSCWLICR